MPSNLLRWTLVAILAGIAGVGSALAEDWPRWRGPRGDGTWIGPELPERWPEAGLVPKWKRPIGGGYAAVVASQGRVYVFDRPAQAGKRANAERIACFAIETGEPIWEHVHAADYAAMPDQTYDNGPRACPTIHHGRLYAAGAVGAFVCLDAKTGKLLWKKDLVQSLGGRIPEWGFASAPVIFENLVIAHPGAEGACVVAFDRTTGAEIWRALSDPAGYNTPLVVDRPAGPLLVLWTPENVQGLDPRSGQSLWTVPYRIRYGVSIATPICHEDVVFVTGYWEEGSKAIALGSTPRDAQLLWQDRRNLRGLMAPPLYKNGLVYSLDKEFGVTCFELKTGKKLWDDDHRLTPAGRNPQATFYWLNGGPRVLALNSEGELVLARFTPAGYQETDRTKIIGATWASPAVVDGMLFARSDTELVRVDLVPSASPSRRGK